MPITKQITNNIVKMMAIYLYIADALIQPVLPKTKAAGAEAAGVIYANWKQKSIHMIKGTGETPMLSQIGQQILIKMTNSTALLATLVISVPRSSTMAAKKRKDLPKNSGESVWIRNALMPVTSLVRILENGRMIANR